MDGIMYVVNQLGVALSQANAQIQQVTAENAQLRAALNAARTEESEPIPPSE